MKAAIPFQVLNDGKCNTCTETKPLDTMVREDYVKGKYHCNDCKTIDEAHRYLPEDQKVFNVAPSKMQKLMRFLCG